MQFITKSISESENISNLSLKSLTVFIQKHQSYLAIAKILTEQHDIFINDLIKILEISDGKFDSLEIGVIASFKEYISSLFSLIVYSLVADSNEIITQNCFMEIKKNCKNISKFNYLVVRGMITLKDQVILFLNDKFNSEDIAKVERDFEKLNKIINTDIITNNHKFSVESFRGILKGANTDNIRDRQDR